MATRERRRLADSRRNLLTATLASARRSTPTPRDAITWRSDLPSNGIEEGVRWPSPRAPLGVGVNSVGGELETLMVLTEELLLEPTLEESLQLVTDAALDLVPADHSSVRLLDESGTRLLSGARSGVGSEHRPVRLDPHEGLAGWVLRNGERVHVEDVSSDPRFVDKDGQGFSISSVIVVPLVAPDMVVGVLSVSAASRSAFDDDDIVLVQLLANCCAPSVLRSRLRRLSVTDHQTQALNQRALFPRLRVEMDAAERTETPLSVLMLDLDHFKRVNDEHGHAAGDHVLSVFADRTRSSIRSRDILVRRGGEEFVVILPATASGDAVRVAERIRESLADDPITLPDGSACAQTVSVGVATWDREEDAERLERRADEAMYDSKRRGRNLVSVWRSSSPDTTLRTDDDDA